MPERTRCRRRTPTRAPWLNAYKADRRGEKGLGASPQFKGKQARSRKITFMKQNVLSVFTRPVGRGESKAGKAGRRRGGRGGGAMRGNRVGDRWFKTVSASSKRCRHWAPQINRVVSSGKNSMLWGIPINTIKGRGGEEGEGGGRREEEKKS